MGRFGKMWRLRVPILLAVLVAVFGMAQLAWVGYTSPDPNPNPVGNGMLMMACWFLCITLFGAAAYVVINLIVDIVQAGLDPRVRLA